MERESPVAHAELADALRAVGFELRGPQEAGEVVARHEGAEFVIAGWRGRLTGQPQSDWEVAQLARVAQVLNARLVGEDGEVYAIRDGVVEQVNGGSSYEFGKVDEILAAGPAQWSR